jgi:teichuronic acid biosynthesis glycosyltransferase TuaH
MWDGLIVICATTYWTGSRLLDQHIAEGLCCYAPVLYVDPPTSALTRFRNPQAAGNGGLPRLSIVRPNLSVLRPRVAPLKERPVGKQIAMNSMRRAIRRAVRDLGAKRVQALIVPSLNRLFGAAGEAVSVFYAKDDYLAGARLMGIQPRRLQRRAAQQPLEADVVIAASPVLADQYRELGIDTILVPNGCDLAHFENVPSTTLRSPVVAFAGHLSDRIDLNMLEAVADLGGELRLIGARQQTMRNIDRLESIIARDNVHWRGHVPYSDLPDELADVTTCLLPYANTDFNRASFPLKVLEYLAAGRRVVASDLPAMRWLDTDMITIASDATSFSDAVAESLRRPLLAPEIAQRRAFCEQHTWQQRVRTIADALGLDLHAPQSTAGLR